MNDVTFDVVNNLTENGTCRIFRKGAKDPRCVIAREELEEEIVYTIYGSDGEELCSNVLYILGITDTTAESVNRRLAYASLAGYSDGPLDFQSLDLETLESDIRYELAENELWLMSKSVTCCTKERACLSLMKHSKEGKVDPDVLLRQWSRYQPEGQEQDVLRYNSWLRTFRNVCNIDKTFPDEYAVRAFTDKYVVLCKTDRDEISDVETFQREKYTYELLDVETFQPVLPAEYTINEISENLVRIRKDDKYGLVMLENLTFTIPCEYDNIMLSGMFTQTEWQVNTAVWIEKEGLWGLINADTGAFIIPLQYDDIGEQNPFDMFTPVKRNGKWGWVVPCDTDTDKRKRHTVNKFVSEEYCHIFARCTEYDGFEEWLEADVEGVKENSFAEAIPFDFDTGDSCVAVREGDLWGLLKLAEGRNFPTFVLTEPLKEQLWLPPEQCQNAVRQNGKALRFVPEHLKTAEMCRAAVQEDGLMLQFVPENLKTEELCRIIESNSDLADESTYDPDEDEDEAAEAAEEHHEENSNPVLG